ncbi:Hypothetical predicted protein [Lecanosticta acicola]|uniref:Uncharacterized protein n=1 Tax=Lecanosticta acicola TaxID=111012 RepID=A0AAI8YRJ8_9PEZI|nr:Hypothetical predicted protein [Lecanosticta acicola]
MSRNNQTPQNPISFKTVPGRHRTQKWSKAPTYSYEGDDWGGYDPYDEYGGPDEEPPPPVPSMSPYSAQQGKPRGRQSFDRGDEARQFSAPAGSAFPSFDPGERDQRQMSAGPSSATSVERGSTDLPRSGSRPRDFTNPDAAPPPLMTKAAAPPAQWFPPRKSSLRGDTPESRAQAEEARAIAAALGEAPHTSPVTNTDKPLPFIRPSDIYKRIPDEIRRQSEEGSRPSTDSLQREVSPSQPALTPVEESRESRLLAGYEVPKIDTDVRKAAPERTLSPNSRSQLPSIAAARSRDASPAPRSQPPSLQTDFNSAQRGSSTNSSLPEQQFPSSGAAVVETNSQSDMQGHDAHSVAARVFNAPVLNSAAAAPASSIQNTPTTSRASAHDRPVGADAEPNTIGLQHQPSAGFRSAVHQAFDRPDDPSLSRDGSQGTSSGVSRSDTNSTAGISPIMSRVPSAATAQLRQQKLDGQVPPIAEESTVTPTGSRPGSGLQGMQRIARKPSPGHSRNASGEEHPGLESGYRRSLDPPSNGTSPARTPGLQTTANRRLSTPMSAVTMVGHDDPDVPEPELQPASEVSAILDLEEPVTSKPLPSVGRGRSGTDYSTREADIADTVNSSPDKGVASPNIAQAQRDSQKLFLDTHGTPASPPSPAIKESNRSVTGMPTHGSRAGSPAKGRVREIADKFHEIHQNSRRNSAASVASSQSSWSQFGDAPKVKRQGTSQSQLATDSGIADSGEPARPEIGREESFRPDLPGGWISTAPTPGIETPPEQSALNTRSPRMATEDGKVDLTPTTKKYRLSQGHVAGESRPVPTDKAGNSAFDAVRHAGDQLAASLLGNVGIGHQTRDFVSTEPAAPVDQPEMQPKPERGTLGPHPPLLRQETDSTEAPSSVAASIPPSPPVQDTPEQDALDVTGGGYFDTVAPLRVRSRESSPQRAGSLTQRPAVLPTLSTDADAGGFESDRLRREIARSLDSIKREELEHHTMLEDTERTQDALDAPGNERRVEQERPTIPAAEADPPRPGLLTTRFSWEDKGDGQTLPKVVEPVPEPASPEIKPEAAYERPRSRNLHVMNADASDSPVEESSPIMREPHFATNALMGSLSAGGASDTAKGVSPITKGQEHLLPETIVQPGSPSESLRDLAPSPLSEHAEDLTGAAWRLPSYYAGEHDQELSHAPEKDHTNASAMSQPSIPSLPKSAGPIPPFRNILALKTSDERIKTYNDTRQTFADMHTGLNDWLSQMLAAHPEHAEALSSGVLKAPALQSQTSNFKRGHRPSPSLAKLTNRFASGERQRSTSVGTTEDGPGPSASASAGGSRIDTEKMQQRGKDFMKSAGVFGGKAQAGAKGLFAKGKSRFGSTRGKTGNEVE